MFWRSKELDKKSKGVKEPLIAEETEYKEDYEDTDYRLWMDYQPHRDTEVANPKGFHAGIMKGKLEPISIHTEYGDSTLRVMSESEHTPIKVEMFSPSARINNYFNSLSQEQCTKLINEFGKMLDEL